MIGVPPTIPSTIPSGLSIAQKCTQPSITSPDMVSIKKSIGSEGMPIQFNLKPTTVLSKSMTVTTTTMSRSNEPSVISIRTQPHIRPKIGTVVGRGQLNSVTKYTKFHTALAGTESVALSPSAKLVKIAPSLSTTNAISDIKTSPVIIVQAPAQKLGQKFTSVKILQKYQSPAGSTVGKQKILNFNDMRKLNSSASLKPIILNATTTSTVISSSEANSQSLTTYPLGYVVPPSSSLIVLKPSTTTSASATMTSSSTTFQLKPQQLYQPNPIKPTTFSIGKQSENTPKTSISIGKLIPSRIFTTVKPNTTDASTVIPVTQHSQHSLPVGLTKIPKDTVVKQIPTKDAQGANIDFLKMIKANKSEKLVEPTVTIGQKPMCNKPPLEFQSLTNFLNSNDKPKTLASNVTKQTDHQPPINLQLSNGKLIEKIEKIKLDKGIESITISNGTLSNPNGSIKMLKNITDMEAIKLTSTEAKDDGCYVMKTLDKLKTSPRLLGRSKSLTMSKNQTKKVRRRFPSSGNCLPMISTIEKITTHTTKPAADSDEKINTACTTIEEMIEAVEENPIQKDPIQKEIQKDVSIETAEKKPIRKESIQSEQKKTVRNSLECDEKIDDSDKSKSVSPDVGDGAVVRSSPNAIANLNPSNTLIYSCVDGKKDDPLTYIKWRNGIGFLKFSNLQFRKNEFGLLETHEEKEFLKTQHNIKQPLMGQRNDDGEQMDCEEKKTDSSDKNCTMGKKKSESKQRFKKAGMNLLQNVFVWELYLKLMDAQAAPDNLFINPFPSSPNLFEVGMKLEAIDPEHCSLFCVCTVVEKLGYRIRLAFDGYSDKYSFWRNADSMEIFPPGWCAKTNRPLQPPLKYGGEPFDWHRYILKTNGKFAPRSNFTHLNSMVSLRSSKHASAKLTTKFCTDIAQPV